MKILIKAKEETVANRVKEILESFGKGMYVYTKDDGFSYYRCVVRVGDVASFLVPALSCRLDEPMSDEDWQQLEKQLWAFYRDNLKDAFGNRCSCGLFEYCHCH